MLDRVELLRRFDGPLHIAATLMFSYYLKRAKRLCTDEQYANISKEFHQLVAIGTNVDFAIPQIGAGLGALSALHMLARMLFLISDQKGYLKYVNHVRKSEMSWDFAFQEEIWGCNEVEVAACLLQSFCCGLELTQSYYDGVLADEFRGTEGGDAHLLHIAALWTHVLHKTKSPPRFEDEGSYFPAQDALAGLKVIAANYCQTAEVSPFFDKSREDLPPETAPEFFKGSKIPVTSKPSDKEADNSASREDEQDIEELFE